MSNIITGRQLRAARILAGLIQRQLAQAGGVHERAALAIASPGSRPLKSARYERYCRLRAIAQP
jgi:transcriptional regulator with XRE-family HTH domain